MVCVRALCLERYAGLQSGIPLQGIYEPPEDDLNEIETC